MPVVVHDRPHRAVRSSVFVGSLGVIGVAETAVPAVQTRDLVPHEAGAAPSRCPVNGLAYGGRHDDAPVVGHIGIAPSGCAIKSSKGIDPSGPMNAEHRWLVGSCDGRQVLATGGR